MIDQKVKLHVGCGMSKLFDYTNIDLRETPCTDVVADCRNLPYLQDSVDEIISFHLIEHFDEPHIIDLLKYWYSLLKKGGKLIAETPNTIGMARRFVKVYEEEKLTKPGYLYGCHNKEGREGIPNDNHLWGYSPESIKKYFEDIGLKNVIVTEGTDYHSRDYDEGYTIRCEGTK